MRFPRICCLVFVIGLTQLQAEQLPEMRPALLGNGPRSWINRINTARLLKQGQKDAMVMFTCEITDTGWCFNVDFYEGTPGSEPLAEEALEEARNARFLPAVYHHQPRYTAIFGTIVFRVIEGRSQLRIYLNQHTEHLLRGDDFIAPQPVDVPGKKFEGFKWPDAGKGFSGAAVLGIDVDATGNLTGARVIYEAPKGRGFGDEILSQVKKVTFLPGYLHGQPVACSTTARVIFQGPGRGHHWKND